MSRNPLGDLLGQVLRGATRRSSPRRSPTSGTPRRRAYSPRKPWWWAIIVGIVGIVGALVTQMGKSDGSATTSSKPPVTESRSEAKAPPADSTKKIEPRKTDTKSGTKVETDQNRVSSSGKAGSRWAADRALVGNDKIAQLFDTRKGKVWVVGTGKISRELYVDTEAPRHQKFLVKLNGEDITVRIAHNIDIGQLAVIKVGDAIEFKGEYVYTEQGGTIHWTHHDPDGKPGGYLLVNGKRFE